MCCKRGKKYIEVISNGSIDNIALDDVEKISIKKLDDNKAKLIIFPKGDVLIIEYYSSYENILKYYHNIRDLQMDNSEYGGIATVGNINIIGAKHQDCFVPVNKHNIHIR